MKILVLPNLCSHPVCRMCFECFLLKTHLSGYFGNLCSTICCNSEIISLEQYREECCSLCRPVKFFLTRCKNIVGNARSQIHLTKRVVSWSGHYQIFWEQDNNRTHKLGISWQGMTSLLLKVICLWSWGSAVKKSTPVPAVTEMGEEEAAWLCEKGEMAVDSSCWVKHRDSRTPLSVSHPYRLLGAVALPCLETFCAWGGFTGEAQQLCQHR